MPNSVCIQPCLGLGMNLRTIGRQASYLAHHRLGAERAHLGGAPALYANVHEDVVFLMIDYVIAVESGDKGCANHLVREKGGSVHHNQFPASHLGEICRETFRDHAALKDRLGKLPLEAPDHEQYVSR